MKEFILAIEGGGTKTRVLLADLSGSVVAREVGGAGSPLYIVRKRYARELRTLLRRIRRAADRAGGRVVAAGFAGPMARDLAEQTVQDTFGPVACVLYGEGEIGLALFGLTWGLVLVSGTGASCWARTREGTRVSRGGFGPQFGDEGSGYWIGREAVAAAMRAQEGRGPATALRDVIRERFAVADVREMVRHAGQSGHVSGTCIAALAEDVTAAAQAGDAVAKNICLRAGTELGKLVVQTAEAARFSDSPISLVLTGGVFRGGKLIVAPLGRALRRSSFVFDVLPAAPDPAAGLIRRMQDHLAKRAHGKRAGEKRHVS